MTLVREAAAAAEAVEAAGVAAGAAESKVSNSDWALIWLERSR